MNISIQDAIAVLVPAFTVITWLLRLEGRINVTDARFNDIIARLVRIEAKQDQE
jgi:hypothetical protein